MSLMDEGTLITLIALAISMLIGSGGAVAAMYIYMKQRLHALRKLIDLLDDALYDDTVTEDEFRRIWEQFKALLRG